MASSKEIIKIIVLGNSNVGKSSLIERYVYNKYTGVRNATVGADFSTKKIVLNNTETIVQIWDTAGLERFHHGQLGNAFYRGAHGALIVYDVTNESSLEHVSQWRAELHSRFGSEDLPLVIVANKIDLKMAKSPRKNAAPTMPNGESNELAVSKADGLPEIEQQNAQLATVAPIDSFLGGTYSNPGVLQYCLSHKYAHIEASAKDGTGIDAAVRTVVMLALENIRNMQHLQTRQRSGSNIVQLKNGFDQYDVKQKRCC